MPFQRVQVIGGPLHLSTPEEVAFVEAQLNTKFPDGYREFVTTLGSGDYAGLIRVYMPLRILKDLEEFRQRWDEYYFWDEGCEVLKKDQVLESIIVADTLNGDEIIFHPKATDALYVLPIDEEKIYQIGSTLYEALDWICDSGVLTTEVLSRDFEPYGGV